MILVYLLGDISSRGTNLFLQGDGSAGNQSNNSQSSSYANYIVSAGAGVGGVAGVTSIGGRTTNIGDNAISLNQIANISGGNGPVTSLNTIDILGYAKGQTGSIQLAVSVYTIVVIIGIALNLIGQRTSSYLKAINRNGSGKGYASGDNRSADLAGIAISYGELERSVSGNLQSNLVIYMSGLNGIATSDIPTFSSPVKAGTSSQLSGLPSLAVNSA